MVPEIKLKDGEQIIKIFLPKSKIHFEHYFSRPVLIFSNERIILKGIFKIFDREIKYEDISDVLIGKNPDRPDLEILKSGTSPVVGGVILIVRALIIGPEPLMYKPYIRCSWLSEEDKQDALSFIKEKIKIKQKS